MSRPLPATLSAVALLGGSLVLAACGSGSGSAGAGSATDGGGAAKAQAKAPSSLCQELNAVLADGPDPDADPVGYALSQILPLQQVHSSDAAVMASVGQLVAADKTFDRSNGADKSAAAAIQKNYRALDRACPGVAP